ncbi:MAG: hypothetical protein JW952_06630 [Candidatus Eisenbacteria bacterium]|nr:hypothetical protein [Candidatus Eisenbacteria bacterium]
MIHRRTVPAIIVLFSLAFVFLSVNDSFAGVFAEKRFDYAREEGVASSRSDGSVLPTNGDPDEPSTWKRNTTGEGFIPFGGDCWRGRFGERFWFESRRDFVRFVWMYLRSGAVGVF